MFRTTLLASPLLAGNDVRSQSRATLDILTKGGGIGVNQDRLGRQATRVAQEGGSGRARSTAAPGRSAYSIAGKIPLQ